MLAKQSARDRTNTWVWRIDRQLRGKVAKQPRLSGNKGVMASKSEITVGNTVNPHTRHACPACASDGASVTEWSPITSSSPLWVHNLQVGKLSSWLAEGRWFTKVLLRKHLSEMIGVASGVSSTNNNWTSLSSPEVGVKKRFCLGLVSWRTCRYRVLPVFDGMRHLGCGWQRGWRPDSALPAYPSPADVGGRILFTNRAPTLDERRRRKEGWAEPPVTPFLSFFFLSLFSKPGIANTTPDTTFKARPVYNSLVPSRITTKLVYPLMSWSRRSEEVTKHSVVCK